MTRSRPRTSWPHAVGFTTIGALLMVAACETPRPASLGPLGGGGTRSGSDAAAPGKDDPVTVTIAPHGQYAIHGQPVPVHQLAQRLQGIYTSRSGERLLHVEAREGVVGYDLVMATSAHAKQAFAASVASPRCRRMVRRVRVVEWRWEETLSPLDTLGMGTKPDTAIALEGVAHRSSHDGAPRRGISVADTI